VIHLRTLRLLEYEAKPTRVKRASQRSLDAMKWNRGFTTKHWFRYASSRLHS